jgi:ribose transport system substrate-binding protein
MMKRHLRGWLAATAILGSTLTAAPAAELTSVGITVGHLGNPFFVEVADAAIRKLRELAGPKVQVTVVSGDYDLDLQMSQVENFVTAGVQLLILGAVDSKGMYPAVAKAHEAGIPVVAVDVSAEGADATVMSDNSQAGRLGCTYIAERLGGKGKVVILNGPPVSAVADRVSGCKAVLAGFPDIEILSDDRNASGSFPGGLTTMDLLLTMHPQIDAVFAQNDPTGLGAAMAVRQRGREGLFIVGVDGSPLAVEALRSGEGLFVATSAQSPRAMAARSAEIGYGLVQGQQPAEELTLIPVTLISSENVDSYQGWGTE